MDHTCAHSENVKFWHLTCLKKYTIRVWLLLDFWICKGQSSAQIKHKIWFFRADPNVTDLYLLYFKYLPNVNDLEA